MLYWMYYLSCAALGMSLGELVYYGYKPYFLLVCMFSFTAMLARQWIKEEGAM